MVPGGSTKAVSVVAKVSRSSCQKFSLVREVLDVRPALEPIENESDDNACVKGNLLSGAKHFVPPWDLSMHLCMYSTCNVV